MGVVQVSMGTRSNYLLSASAVLKLAKGKYQTICGIILPLIELFGSRYFDNIIPNMSVHADTASWSVNVFHQPEEGAPFIMHVY